MIDDLLEAKLISPHEMKLYRLFTSDLGRECLLQMIEEAFWEEPTEEFFTEAHFAFYDGRRSFLRAIKAVIGKVEMLVHKQNLGAPNEG